MKKQSSKHHVKNETHQPCVFFIENQTDTFSSNGLAHVVASVNYPIVIVDHTGKFIISNHVFNEILEYRVEDLKNITLNNIISTGEEQRPTWQQMKEGVLTTVVCTGKKGISFQTSIKIHSFLHEDNTYYIIHFLELYERSSNSLQNNNTDGYEDELVVNMNEAGDLSFVNQPFKDFCGVVSLKKGMNMYSFIHLEDKDVFVKNLKKVFFSPYHGHVEIRLLSVHGYKWYGWNLHPAFDDEGNILYIQGVGKDVTTLKKTEDSLRVTENQLYVLLESIPQGILFLDSYGKTFLINQAALKLLGLKKEGVIGKTFKEMPVSIVDELGKHVPFSGLPSQLALKGQVVENVIMGFVSSETNKKSWVMLNAIPQYIKNEKMPDRVIITLQDITDQKITQYALIESERQLYNLMANMPGLVYRCRNDKDWTMLLISQGCETLTGYKPNDLLFNKNLSFNDIILDEDRFLNYDKIMLALNTQKPFQAEYRICTKDRRIKWVWEKGQGVYDIHDNLLCIEGIILDITNNKLAEKALKERERQMSLLMENLPGMVYRCKNDKDWTMEFISQGCYDLTGYLPEELLFNKYITYDNLIIPEDRSYVWDEVQKALHEKCNFEVEYQILTRDGEQIWVWEKGQGVFGDEDQLLWIEGIILNINKRKEAEQEFIQSEERFRKIVNSSPMGINLYEVDTKGDLILIDANAASQMFTTIDREELLGKKIEEAFPNLKDTEIPSKYKEVALKGNGYSIQKLYYKDKDGKTEGYFDIYAFRISPGKVAVMFVDITDRLKAEENYLKTKEKFEKYIKNSPTPVLIHDQNGKYSFVNHAACKMYEYSKKDFYRLTVYDLVPDSEKDKAEENLNTLKKTGKVFDAEINHLTKSGTPLTVLMDSIKIDENEFLVFAKDITIMKKIQEELILAKEKAEESDRLKSAFLANLSHEIRTPLNGILGFSELLKKEDVSGPKHKRYLEIIDIKGKQLLQLISDIVDISKIEAGQLVLNKKEFSLYAHFKNIYTSFENQFFREKKSVIFELHIPYSDRNTMYFSDPYRIDQILSNLLTNAIKFTDTGKIVLGYEKVSDNLVKLFVEDTGIGISPNNQKIIFNRFRQVESIGKFNTGGTGLGLSICKGLTDLLNGDIKLKSSENKGSRFEVMIPIKPIARNIHENIQEMSEIQKYKWPGKTILVAEDDSYNSMYLQALLEQTGAKIILVLNGQEAVDSCRNDKNISAVLMDIKMPIKNGIDATREIRKFRETLPIIAQTAYAMSADEDYCLEAGCDAYIAKPINSQELLKILDKFINP